MPRGLRRGRARDRPRRHGAGNGALRGPAGRAAHLKTVAPKLRAKEAGAAVEMFLARDAVAASALPLPDRAARRLCDRLVELGAIRELTGRETFRLYGV